MDFFLLLHNAALFLLLAFHARSVRSSSSHTEFHVGVILDGNSSSSPVGPIGLSCLAQAHSDFYQVHNDSTTRLVVHLRDSNSSVVDAAAAALHLLQIDKVDAIIGPQSSTQANFVMDLGDRAKVPIVSFSATSPSLIPRTPYFVRTAESDANQVQAIASIVEAYRWNQVVIVYEDTEFGYGIMPYLSNALQDVNVRVSYKSVFPQLATDDFISKELYKMKTMQTRVYIVHMSVSLGTRFFLKAKDQGMMTNGYAWIVTSGLTDLFSLQMNDDDVVEAMQGVLGIRPEVPNSKQLRQFSYKLLRNFFLANEYPKLTDHTSIFCLWAYDTMWALAMAAERVGVRERISHEYVPCPHAFDLEVSDTGPKLLDALLETRFCGLAGDFQIINGELRQKSYQIINVVGAARRQVAIWTPSCGLSDGKNLNKTGCDLHKNFKTVIWPGGSTTVPRGFEVPVDGKRLRIGVSQKPGFNEFLTVETDPHTSATIVSGYFKDIFESVIKSLPYAIKFDYIAYPFYNRNGSRAGSYDDLVYQVSLQENYDAALGDITITETRSAYADFTLPFAEGGITAVVSIKYEHDNNERTFLQPLSKELWLTIVIFYISTAAAIWILGYWAVTDHREADSQHIGLIAYFPFFPGQGIAVGLLCLVLVTWALVGSLLNSTYTASLSSLLTVQRLQPTVTDVTQLIKYGDYVGTQEGSFLVNFLTNLGFDASKIKTYKSAEDSDEALTKGSKNGGISAYYDVIPHIRLFISQYCGKYKMVGPVYRTTGFGFAFPKGSPVVSDISRAIIQQTEKGRIQEIEQILSSSSQCLGPDGNSTGTRITLRSFVVLFGITGSVTLACILISLLLYLDRGRPLRDRFADFRVYVSRNILSLQALIKDKFAWFFRGWR